MAAVQGASLQTEAERIADAYLAAHGNARAALIEAIADALADLCEAERRTAQRDRLVSRGYVRGRPLAHVP